MPDSISAFFRGLDSSSGSNPASEFFPLRSIRTFAILLLSTGDCLRTLRWQLQPLR